MAKRLWMALALGAGLLLRGAAWGDAPMSPNRVPLDPTADAVDTAMKKAVDYLLAQKKGDNFETFGQPWVPQEYAPDTGGETALVTYALLHAGRSMDDPRLVSNSPELAPVLNYLSKLQQDGTYAAGLTALALSFLPENGENKRRFKSAGEFLLRAMNQNPAMRRDNGGWSYQLPLTQEMKNEIIQQFKKENAVDDKGIKGLQDDAKKTQALTWEVPDGSNSQYGVLGLWAMDQYGIEIPMGVWGTVDNYWRSMIEASGEIAYRRDQAKTERDSMGAAGVASLYITDEMLDTEVRLEPRTDKLLELGMTAVIKNFKPATDDCYYTYGLTRVGMASGLKFFGTQNWYREVADATIRRQGGDGGIGGGFWGGRGTTTTAYALLILARGRNPVPFNKLKYDGPWNARPRDDAHLVEWMGKKYEKEYNWQVVGLDFPPEEWMDAPVLLITGSKKLDFKPEEIAKLKRFIDMGGLIFSTSDGGSGSDFDRSVRQIMKKLYPQYEPRSLKWDSMFFNGELRTDPIKSPPGVWALGNGAREFWLHTSADLGASWQKRAYAEKSHWTLPMNVFLYATGISPARTKLDDIMVRPGDAAMKSQVSVAKLDLGPNADPEPYAWERMALIEKADVLTGVTLDKCKAAELAGKKPVLATLTGTGGFIPSADEIAGIQTYLKAGGMLFADATAGNPAFTKSFVELAQKLYPNQPLEDIAPDDPLLKGTADGGAPIDTVDFRKYSRLKTHAKKGEMQTEKLRGIKDGGRWVVVFSEYDVTSGLLGTETWGIDGYEPDSAVAIMRNVLAYAAKGGG